MKLKAIRAHYLDGNVQATGAVYDAPEALARQLVAAGKSIAAPVEDKPAAKTKAASKIKAMSVASIPALVPGATQIEERDHHD